jgi:ABC-type Na+ efflux pump permease subunit
MNTWTTVFRREYRLRALSPVNWIIMLAVAAVAFLGVMTAPQLSQGFGTGAATWAVSDESSADAVVAQLGLPTEATAAADAETIRLDDVDGELVISASAQLPPALLAGIEAAQARVDLASIAEAAGVQATATPLRVVVSSTAGSDDIEQFLIMVIVLAVVFGFVMLSATSLATGLVEERSTNVIEIMAPYVPARQLLLGKIAAIGAFTLTQAIFIAASAALAAVVSGAELVLSGQYAALLVSALIWMVIAYLSFAALFSVAASLVSSQEDAGALLNPLGMVMFVPLFLASFVIPDDPASTFAVIMSFVPFFGPFVMIVRQSFGAAEPLEVVLSMGVSIVAALLLASFAAWVFRRTLLRRGHRLRLRDVLTDTRTNAHRPSEGAI